jgi:ribulose-5-phosphate 4-epimerase/fuculose-1-phosphate aldolase
MHERVLMRDLMQKIEAESCGARVTRVRVRLGALSHFSEEHFREHFDDASRGTVAEDAAVDVELRTDPTEDEAQGVVLESIDVEAARRTVPKTYAFVTGKEPHGATALLVAQLRDSLRLAAWREISVDDATLVVNLVDPDAPQPFRRHSRGTYSAALYEASVPADEVLSLSYPLLVRSLSNIVLCCTGPAVWFTTMERGCYCVTANGSSTLGDEVVAHLLPLAGARLVIDNEFRSDLEPELWGGDEHTDGIREAGEDLDALGLLPAPFPIEDLLTERDLRHVKRLYGIGGLSYGNLSERRDARRFWMSASGVDKANLELPGRDILLVSDYDAARGVIVLSVPPNVEPRRVSVDAIEHWMIYQEHPDVGAILHVHGWIDGIPSTQLNYPCGSEELAASVAALVAEQPDPAHAVIGLHNHGITVTGESLSEILDRIGSRVRVQVPMSA